jgi:hypothetical protein
MPRIQWCRSLAADSGGIATVAEYALLLGISIMVLLALCAAFWAFSSNARADAVSVAAYGVASRVGCTVTEAAGNGESSAELAIDLPDRICGMPYLAYPSTDGKHICVILGQGGIGHEHKAPVPLRVSGVRIAGFIASPPGGHAARYDAAARTVTIS